jgi:hypothetical protein
MLDFRYGYIDERDDHVRFTPKSGHRLALR